MAGNAQIECVRGVVVVWCCSCAMTEGCAHASRALNDGRTTRVAPAPEEHVTSRGGAMTVRVGLEGNGCTTKD